MLVREVRSERGEGEVVYGVCFYIQLCLPPFLHKCVCVRPGSLSPWDSYVYNSHLYAFIVHIDCIIKRFIVVGVVIVVMTDENPMVPFMPFAVYTCRCVCVSVRACLCAWTEGIRGQVELPKFTAHNTHPDVSYIRTRRQSDTGKRAFRSSPMWGRRRRCRLRHSASLCSAFGYIAQKWERARGV